MDLPLTELRAMLGLSSTSADTTLTRLLNAAVAFIERYTGLGLSSASYTETYDGDGGDYLPLDHAPVSAVTSVTIASDAIPESTSYDVAGWYLERNAVKLNGYEFSIGRRTVTVVYTAGYSTVPYDLTHAVIELAATIYEGAKRLGQKSKQVQQETITFHDSALTPSIREVLDRYRRPVFP